MNRDVRQWFETARRVGMTTLALALTLALATQSGLAAKSTRSAGASTCADTTRLLLGQLLGRYRAAVWFRTGSAGGDTSTATVTIRPALDGCVLEERFVGRRFGSPYSYLAWWGAHAGDPRPIQRVFVHSQHGVLSIAAGAWSADSLVLDDSVNVRGRWIYERLVLRPSSTGFTGGFATAQLRSEDGGQSWFVTQRTRYVRTTR